MLRQAARCLLIPSSDHERTRLTARPTNKTMLIHLEWPRRGEQFIKGQMPSAPRLVRRGERAASLARQTQGDHHADRSPPRMVRFASQGIAERVTQNLIGLLPPRKYLVASRVCTRYAAVSERHVTIAFASWTTPGRASATATKDQPSPRPSDYCNATHRLSRLARRALHRPDDAPSEGREADVRRRAAAFVGRAVAGSPRFRSRGSKSTAHAFESGGIGTRAVASATRRSRATAPGGSPVESILHRLVARPIVAIKQRLDRLRGTRIVSMRHRYRSCLTATPVRADWHLGWGAGAPQRLENHKPCSCPISSDTLHALSAERKMSQDVRLSRKKGRLHRRSDGEMPAA